MSAVGTESVDRHGVTEAEEDSEVADSKWNRLTRIAFRFCFTYFGLFCLIFPQFLFVYSGPLGAKLPERAINGLLYPLSPIWEWVGRHVFGADVELHLDSGSGDQAIIWVFVFTILVVAMVTTVVWTALDRRTSYPRLQAWFLLFLRLCLAGQMLWYGMGKVIPTQMPEPPLVALLTPYGNLTPMSVLWFQVGTSQPYEILLGAAEVLGGLLLFWPRTATLGAMVSLVSMAQVFILNMTFDVPVKILAGHLMLVSLVLLAPQARTLANVLVLQRSAGPAVQPEPFRSRRVRSIAVAVQVALGAWVLLGATQEGLKWWNEGGGGAPKPALYGIWQVSEFNQDGAPLPPLSTDQNRWQRVVFDINGMAYQKMDGTLVPVVGAVDTEAHTITLSEAAGSANPGQAAQAQPNQIGTFAYTQDAPDRLRLDGRLHGRAVTLTLKQMDLDSFPLRSTGFHWVQDYPHFS
ncbi:DoxX family protein [Nocardia brasiliensis]|uniref:DoxX family protein n=1 Tax=Nocardia brasiliensis TaxID=37326 RepID=UPI00366B572A